VYNWLTDNGDAGKRSADLNISIKGREAFMQEVFGTVPVIEKIRAVEPLNQTLLPTYPDIDNQDMLDIIFEVALTFVLGRKHTPAKRDPWRHWIVPAHLEYLSIPTFNRKKPYTGPRIEDLPGLNSEQKQALLVLIHPTNNRSRHFNRPFEGLTNHAMINLIFRAALPFTKDPWKDWVVPAGLEYLGVPRSNRGKPYTGPRIEDLPNLTDEQKNAILALM